MTCFLNRCILSSRHFRKRFYTECIIVHIGWQCPFKDWPPLSERADVWTVKTLAPSNIGKAIAVMPMFERADVWFAHSNIDTSNIGPRQPKLAEISLFQVVGAVTNMYNYPIPFLHASITGSAWLKAAVQPNP